MSAGSFLRNDGALEPRRVWWSGWLPTAAQMRRGALAQFGEAPVVPMPAGDPTTPWYTSMRQGLGLVVASALLAGLLPFVVNWVTATRMGTVVPLAELARAAESRQAAFIAWGPLATMLETAQTVAGLPPSFLPGWLAAFLSALGGWLNWPLRWLAWWIVYGLGVLVVAKLLGTTATLQHFYALTAYAALPLILLGLGPLPIVGWAAQVVAVIWALVVYVTAVRAAAGLSWGQSVVSVVLPGGAAALLALLAAAAVIVSLA
ncbi:MAG TPA: YIP1 family protein [Caldilineaceae bacterium]|nr:YIP1 family protein [Caldilineaceae bacterium]